MKSRLIEDTSWQIPAKFKLEVQDLLMLTEICMKGNFFQFSNEFYVQYEEGVMDSPISPVFAEFLIYKKSSLRVNSRKTTISYLSSTP